jgi:HlyD family secretion protein
MRIQGSGFRVQGSAGNGLGAVSNSRMDNMSRRAERHRGRSLQRILPCMALLLAAGCNPVALAQPKGGKEPAAQGAGGATEVVMAGKPVRKTLTLTTTQPARIEALEQTPIYSKVAAYVGEVLVDYGDKVKKGQPLLKLVAPELDADLAQKQSLLEQARAQLLQAEAGAKAAEAAVVTAQSKVVQTEAGTDRAQTDLVRWRSEFTRIGQLATSGSINRQLVDETQQKLGAAEASLREAGAAIDAAKAVVLQSQAEAAKAASDVTAAKAQVRVAEANVARSEAEHSYLTIQAPFNGVVTLRRVDPGHFVQPAGSSAAPLLVVVRSDKMRTFVAVNEIEAAYVDLGDAVTVEVQSLRGAEFKAKVTRTSFALDPSSRSLDTIIDIDNTEGRLRPGLYAMAKITLQEQQDALTLPGAAVVRQGKEAFCYRLISGKATKTPIQLGIKVADEFEVTSGLSDRDTVILNKASSLKDGQAVEELKPATK